MDIDESCWLRFKKLKSGSPRALIGQAIVGIMVVFGPINFKSLFLEGAFQCFSYFVDITPVFTGGATGGDIGLITVAMVNGDGATPFSTPAETGEFRGEDCGW